MSVDHASLEGYYYNHNPKLRRRRRKRMQCDMVRREPTTKLLEQREGKGCEPDATTQKEERQHIDRKHSCFERRAKNTTMATTTIASTSKTKFPSTMRAAQVKDYGNIDEVLSVKEGVPVPRLADSEPETGLLMGPYGPFMVVRVHAVALAPGDWRSLSGLTRGMQGPKSFPYIPGGDLCGIVEELPEDAEKLNLPFNVGDRVAARFTGRGPKGALCEHAVVDTKIADKVPENLSSDGAAALASASFAIPLADFIRKGDKRVLVLGAGGGLGSHFCQLIRERGAEYVVGVSSSPDRLLKAPLSYNEAIDYTKEDIFSSEKFKKDPFDVVVDLSCGGWLRLEKDASDGVPLIVKTASQGGRYITTLLDKPIIEVSSVWDFMWQMAHPALWRAIKSRLFTRNTLPSYTLAVLGPEERIIMTRTLQHASEGKLQPVMDERGPFPFTTEGVQAAFRLQESRHAHGKVVIHVADEK